MICFIKNRCVSCTTIDLLFTTWTFRKTNSSSISWSRICSKFIDISIESTDFNYIQPKKMLFKDEIRKLLMCPQSGKKTKRASSSSSVPKKISCTLSLSQERHLWGHGSPHKPMPYSFQKENIYIWFYPIKSIYKYGRNSVFSCMVYYIDHDHTVPNINECIVNVHICIRTAEINKKIDVYFVFWKSLNHKPLDRVYTTQHIVFYIAYVHNVFHIGDLNMVGNYLHMMLHKPMNANSDLLVEFFF